MNKQIKKRWLKELRSEHWPATDQYYLTDRHGFPSYLGLLVRTVDLSKYGCSGGKPCLLVQHYMWLRTGPPSGPNPSLHLPLGSLLKKVGLRLSSAERVRRFGLHRKEAIRYISRNL